MLTVSVFVVFVGSLVVVQLVAVSVRCSGETGDDSADGLLVRKRSACRVEHVDRKQVLFVGGDGQCRWLVTVNDNIIW